MIRVRVITPLCTASPAMLETTMAEVEPLVSLGIVFDNVTLGAGPASIENYFDETFAAPHVVIKAMQAEQQGIDAVIIDCMGDPGMMAAREAVRIPVIGPGEAAMHMAGMMGHRFSCVSVMDSVRPILFAHARAYGVADKLASVHVIDMPVLEIERNLELLPDLLFGKCVEAIEQDHADTIILGCTGFVGVAERLEVRLRRDAGYDVPVVNPLPTAALAAATMVWGKMTHSARGYNRRGPSRPIAGYPFTNASRESS